MRERANAMRRNATWAVCLVWLTLAGHLNAAEPEAIESQVEALLGKMTHEEKLGQLTQFTAAPPDLREQIAQGRVGSVFNFGGSANTNELQRIAVENSRLGIPLLFGHDVIHGYRTIFPNPLAIAATWDPASAEQSARIAAIEGRAAGTRWTFAPMIDIARDPRWGRIAEGAGEDPFLASAFARAYVRGFQGSDLSAKDSLMACAKHYVAYGAAEAGRDYNTTDLSERTLREIYLPPFAAAVEAGVGSMMTGFNALNGIPATANPWLVEGILRKEWGFDGFIVSDYEAVEQLIPHGVAATKEEAAAMALASGIDMNMVDGAYALLADDVRAGRFPVALVDQAVRRVLRAKIQVGLFDDPYAEEGGEERVFLLPSHRAAAREVAEKSIVLLKNEGGLLPLSKNIGTIALIGPFVEDGSEMLGSWHAMGRPEDVVTIARGIRNEVAAETTVLVARGTGLLEGADSEIERAVATARLADAVVAFLGEGGKMSGEAMSRVSLSMQGRQEELLKALVATGKPVVLVVKSGRPLTIEWAAENVPAIVYGWFLGTEAGPALANVLFGDVNPSGRLPVTIPRSVGQIPIYYNRLRTGRPATPEDRFTSKYIDSPNEPLWPFGHGLSYTDFVYGDLVLSTREIGTDGTLTVSAQIENRGDRPGEEVVQFYVADPVASISRPVRELKGFQRVALAPGEKRRVVFTVTPEMLRFWKEGEWVIEPGRFNVWIGPGSQEGLEGSFEVRKTARR
ncbi:MAG: glycoside hydrolase family 3 N-terminal domain-containing protein [Thermoanaerobaculia bacterium]